jgi:YHS domain-containing protein
VGNVKRGDPRLSCWSNLAGSPEPGIGGTGNHFVNFIMKLVSIALVLLSINAVAQPEATRQKEFNLDKKVALDEYDPVSYFAGKPAEGDEDNSYTHKGVTYYFVNQANLAKFKSNPDAYEPAYGGWCAYAMGDSGEKVKIDPETFKIINGRLYLFYNFWGNNTLETWNKSEPSLKQKADQNWKKIIP